MLTNSRANEEEVECLPKTMISGEGSIPQLKKFKNVPVYVVEEHNDALQFIYSAIGGKKLPLEGTILLHLDAHPDMLIDRKMIGSDARSGRNVLSLLQIENWIVPGAAAGHIGRVVWLRPPWAKQFSDGTRVINVGDHPDTGLLRVDSIEPYYLSDALYSRTALLRNRRKFTLTVAELSDSLSTDDIEKLVKKIDITEAFVLDIDLDFFSTGNPFLSLYANIELYDRLEPIFSFKLPCDDNVETLEKVVESRERQLQEIENLFQHLEEHGNLEKYKGEKSQLFDMIFKLAADVSSEAERLGEPADWWAVYAAGCTRDQGGLPYNICTKEQIQNTIEKALKPLLQYLPTPVLITVARSTDDGYCPPDQVELIQALVLQTLKDIYETGEPVLHYLKECS